MDRKRRTDMMKEKRQQEEHRRRAREAQRKRKRAITSGVLIGSVLLLSIGIVIFSLSQNKPVPDEQTTSLVASASPAVIPKETEPQASVIPVVSATTTANRANASEIDVMTLSQDELLRLHISICRQRNLTEQSRDFAVPVGRWTVGKNIDAGTYKVSGKSTDYGSIEIKSGYAELLYSYYDSEFIGKVALQNDDIVTISSSDAKFSTRYEMIRLYNGSATEYDLSDLSVADLVLLNESVISALNNWSEYQAFQVPSGVWEIGKDIPAGVYNLRANTDTTLFHVYSMMSDLDNDEMYIYDGWINKNERALAVKLEDGNVINVNGTLTFEEGDDEVKFGG